MEYLWTQKLIHSFTLSIENNSISAGLAVCLSDISIIIKIYSYEYAYTPQLTCCYTQHSSNVMNPMATVTDIALLVQNNAATQICDSTSILYIIRVRCT